MACGTVQAANYVIVLVGVNIRSGSFENSTQMP